MELPRPWKRLVDVRANESVEAIQVCMDRGRPFGESKWVLQTAKELDLEATLRPVGRPRKEAEENE